MIRSLVDQHVRLVAFSLWLPFWFLVGIAPYLMGVEKSSTDPDDQILIVRLVLDSLFNKLQALARPASPRHGHPPSLPCA